MSQARCHWYWYLCALPRQPVTVLYYFPSLHYAVAVFFVLLRKVGLCTHATVVRKRQHATIFFCGLFFHVKKLIACS